MERRETDRPQEPKRLEDLSHRNRDAQPQEDAAEAPAASSADRVVIMTTDPVVVQETRQETAWREHPEATTFVETARDAPAPATTPQGVRAAIIVPASEPSAAGSRHMPVSPASQSSQSTRDDQNGDARQSDENRESDDDKPREDRDNDRKKTHPHRDRAQGADHAKAATHDDDSRQDKPGRTRGRHEDEDDEPHEKSPSQGLGMRSLLITAAVALVCGVAGAWAYSYFFSGSSDDDSSKKSASKQSDSSSGGSSKKSGGNDKGSGGDKSGSGADSSSGSSIPGFTNAEDADALRKQIERVAERVDRLHQRIDTLRQPRNETPPDVRTLQIKVGELASEIDNVANLPSKYRRLENQIESLREDLKTLRSRIADEAESMTRDGDSSDISAVDRAVRDLANERARIVSPGPPGDLEADAAMAEAIALFHRGKYAQSRDIFRKLQLTRPEDARVWYYSALSYGLTSGQWSTEAQKLADRGAEKERAGHPAAPAIDDALAGVTKAQGKDWLASIRNRLARH